jgi:glycosyltransferase involved in cell wall biosynthesis
MGVRGPRVRIALVIPTLNEEESIGPVIRSIPPGAVDRIIVADGGSFDHTSQEARAAGAEVINAGRGYGRACLTGSMAANDADIIVFMDGDGADDPADITTLIAPIEAGTHDFITGSRVRGTAEAASMAWHQRYAGIAIGLAMRALYRIRYTDMCAFRAIRRDALLALGMREMTYGWNLEMQMRATRAGLRIQEVPVNNRRRIGGRSKVAGSLRGSLNAGAEIILTFARIAIESLKPVRPP